MITFLETLLRYYNVKNNAILTLYKRSIKTLYNVLETFLKRKCVSWDIAAFQPFNTWLFKLDFNFMFFLN